ncbi:MAG: UDP-N-acetylmuramoyl-L-alanyl-D-glutamate--2,6-diaminopimelate ligase [Bacteroidales bacterium]|nr:UDP-N-acetylmuramoyl-L-alanyl-D-glutamate--2,6-diaminopimelate ligase [Bacteroidales bacterium]
MSELKKLEHIIKGIDCRVYGQTDVEVNGVVFDSRKIARGNVFVAVRGTQVDGHNYLSEAASKGAVGIICEHFPEDLDDAISKVVVKNSSIALGIAAANFYDNPSEELKVVGITGTNGKTSIATLLYRLFSKLEQKSGLLSTVKNMVGDKEITATHTTPDAVTIQWILKEMVDAGCRYAFMEISSHAIDQNRITGLDIDIAVFTNLTHDHLDYHKDFNSYLKAKKKLFDGLPSHAIALINTDDKHSGILVQNTDATVKTYGVHSLAEYKAKIIENHFDGMLIQIDNTEVWTKIIGEFNASNLLAVYTVARLMGFQKHEILRILSSLDTVEGRFEYVQSNSGVIAIIDYAHTPDALKNVLKTINQIIGDKSQIITVVGAGGDRDKTKRPIMGGIAAELSNKVVLTSDNPRGEEPQVIIDEMMKGVPSNLKNQVLSIADRKEAIRTACMLAKSGDVILIAGKGHETYQEIKGEKHFFSDKKVVSELFMTNNFNLQ